MSASEDGTRSEPSIVGAAASDSEPERRVGALLRQSRLEANVSLREMARRLHYGSHSILSSYEKGHVMPSDEIVLGYERILDKSGALMPALEQARRERHGDAWAKKRQHIPLSAADESRQGTRGSHTFRISDLAGWSNRKMLAAGVVVLFVIIGGLIAVVARNGRASRMGEVVAPSVSPSIMAVRDGADPKDSGCAQGADVVTLDSVEVVVDGRPVGLGELRYAQRCGVSWARFEAFPRSVVPRGAVVHVDVVRPDDRGQRIAYEAKYVEVAIYGNVMVSTSRCVFAAVRIDVPGRPGMESQTHCYRGRTPVLDTGSMG